MFRLRRPLVKVDGIEVRVEGDGAETVVMVHGWPDTLHLWDRSVDALAPHWRCVRFTLPGFDLSRRDRAYSLEEVVETLHQVVTQTCPGQRITLLLHDWGCLYGCQFAQRHPSLLSRIVGVDIGDAGSAARQPRRRPAHGALGDAGQGRRLQCRGALWLAGTAPTIDR
jgi:pimeloyl-ACP methyl ester carboxylesterase